MLSSISMDKRQLLLLCICFACLSFEATITIRLMPVYAVYLGADAGIAGLLVSFGFLTVTLGNITAGWLSDRIGQRRRILLIGSAVWIPAALTLTQATDLVRLFVATGLLWFPGGLVLAITQIITAVSAPERERGRIFGITNLSFGIGAVIAGLVGGPIAETWSFLALFGVMAALTVVVVGVALFIHDTPNPRATAPSTTQPRTAPLTAPGKAQFGLGMMLLLLLAAHLMIRLGELVGGLASPLLMVGLGFDAAAVSSAISISAAAVLPLPLLVGWLSDRFGRKQILFVLYGMVTCSLLLLTVSQLLWQFWLAAILLQVAEKSHPVAQAYVADLAPPEAIGRSMSFFQTISLFAGIVGLSGAGYLMQGIGIQVTLLLTACLPLLSLALLTRVRKPAPMLGPIEAA
jgi:MFS family permease